MRYTKYLTKVCQARIGQPVMALGDEEGIIPGTKGIVIKKSKDRLTVRWNHGRDGYIHSIRLPLFIFSESDH